MSIALRFNGTGPASAVLTEANLQDLYGIAMKRVAYVHDGRSFESLITVLPARAL